MGEGMHKVSSCRYVQTLVQHKHNDMEDFLSLNSTSLQNLA